MKRVAPVRILVSGFEPFGGQTQNPTQLLCERLAREALLGDEPERVVPPGVAVRSVVLPVTFAGAYPRLREEIHAFAPHVVIAFGQAGGRAAIELERVAINCDDAELADNAGERPRDRVIVEGGPPALFSTLPLRALQGELAAAGIPARISNSAGTFVCNHLFYRLMEEHRFSIRLCGFVHVPFLPKQVQPNMDSDGSGGWSGVNDSGAVSTSVPVPSMELTRMWVALGAILKAVAAEIAFPEFGCQDAVGHHVLK